MQVEKILQTSRKPRHASKIAIVVAGRLGGLLFVYISVFWILSHPALRIFLHVEGLDDIPVVLGIFGMVLFPLPLLLRRAKGRSCEEMLESISWSCPDRVFVTSGVIGMGMGIAYSIVKGHAIGSEFAIFSPIYIIVFAITGIAAALVEEVYFRGILYEALHQRIGGFASIALVTVLFCFIHPKNLLGVFPAAVVLGVIRVYTTSTKASFSCHAMFNLFVAATLLPFHLRW
jgi:membrane protease YdiL (CAAX protease family)